MKIEIDSSELLSAAGLGILVGFFSHASSQRWLRLGRDAYLAHYSQLFDRRMVHPPHLVPMIIVGVVFALAFYAVFKMLALVFRKTLSMIPAPAARQADR